jgi:hypothetical protein
MSLQFCNGLVGAINKAGMANELQAEISAAEKGSKLNFEKPSTKSLASSVYSPSNFKSNLNSNQRY